MPPDEFVVVVCAGVVVELLCPPDPPLAPADPHAASPMPAMATKTTGAARRKGLLLRTTVINVIYFILLDHL